MTCPKHPNEKMTLLLTSYVCDVCDPPEGSVIEESISTPAKSEPVFLTLNELAYLAGCK